jgi:hypothetical protein
MSSMIVASWSSRERPSKVGRGSLAGMGGTNTRGARGAVEAEIMLT